MKVLLIGSPSSIYIKQYIKNVLMPLKAEVLLSSNTSLSDKDNNFYCKSGVKLVDIYKKAGILKNIPCFGTIFSFRKNLKKLFLKERIDTIHIHYVGNLRLMRFSYKIIKKCSSKLILTFWGSDLFSLDKKSAKYLIGLLDSADKIVVPTKSMRRKFNELYGEKYDEKLVSCLFGNPIIDKNIEIKQSKKIIDNHIDFNIPKDKYIISAGYNGSSRQQHSQILEQLSILPSEIKKNLFVVLQMGYGMNNSAYLESLKKIMDEGQLEYLIIDRYINEEETIALKKQVNLFIHGQISDALSSSVLEYIYFETEVLNPKWIEYTEWKNLNIEYIEYEQFKDLSKYVELIYNKKIITNHKKNTEIIEKNFSWINHADDWKALYL